MDLRAHLLKAEFELGDLAYGREIWSYLGSVSGEEFVRLRIILDVVAARRRRFCVEEATAYHLGTARLVVRSSECCDQSS